MKRNAGKSRFIISTRIAGTAALAITLAAAALCANAQSAAVVAGSGPGVAAAAQTVKLSATITAIDKATRDITLKGPQGNSVTLTAGPDLKNFDQLKVGDQVDAQYVEALTLELRKGGGLVVGRTEKADAAAASKGASPGGAVGREVTIVADVVAVDPTRRIVTLRGPNRTVELPISDPEQFKRIAKGDQVEAKYIQAIAIAVTAAGRK